MATAAGYQSILNKLPIMGVSINLFTPFLFKGVLVKVTIELTGDEVDDAKDMLDVFKYKAALDAIQSEVRSMWKHGDYGDEAYAAIERIYDFINSEIGDIHEVL